MADNLSPLVNLDLINQIYKTINAQITERVYNPQYDTSATLGTSSYKYVSAYISGNTSTGTLNDPQALLSLAEPLRRLLQ